jgi:hypothetical protein
MGPSDRLIGMDVLPEATANGLKIPDNLSSGTDSVRNK